MGTCVEAKDTLTFEFGSDDTQLNSMVVTLVESSYGIQVVGFLLLFFILLAMYYSGLILHGFSSSLF